MAAMLAVPPRNLADQSYMGTRSDQQLFDVISKGGTCRGSIRRDDGFWESTQ